MILTEVSNEDVGDLVTRRLTNESWQHIQVRYCIPDPSSVPSPGQKLLLNTLTNWSANQ